MKLKMNPKFNPFCPTQNSQRGQATIELALAIIFLMAFVLFFIQLSMVLAWGNYVQYATFMTSRAYLSSSATLADQQQRAMAYAQIMFNKNGQPDRDRYPSIAQGVASVTATSSGVKGLEIISPTGLAAQNKTQSWQEGVRYTFRSRIFMMSLTGRGSSGSAKDPSNQLDLTSESWLGREPSISECKDGMESGWVEDNGC